MNEDRYQEYILNRLSKKERSFSIVVDCDFPEVSVPKHLKGEQRFDLGFGLPKPALPFCTPRGLWVTLSFGGPFDCFFPWGSINAVFIEEGFLFLFNPGWGSEDPPKKGLRLVK